MFRKLIQKPSVWAFLLIGLFIVSALSVSAESDTSREYYLKAAFLRYVAKFVTWPAEGSSESAINICLLGEFKSLTGLNSINGRMIEDKPILVRPIAKLELAEKDCQILFVSKTEESNLKHIIETLKDKPILSFGDMDAFAELGGGMNFYIVNNKMAIMINQEAVAQSKLKIHPRMLRLVTIVPSIDG